MKKRLPRVRRPLQRQPDLQGPPEGVGHLDLEGRLALGLTGPVLRSHRLPVGPAQVRAVLAATRTYDFEVQTWDTADSYGRFRIRLNEMWESLAHRAGGRPALAGPEGACMVAICCRHGRACSCSRASRTGCAGAPAQTVAHVRQRARRSRSWRNRDSCATARR